MYIQKGLFFLDYPRFAFSFSFLVVLSLIRRSGRLGELVRRPSGNVSIVVPGWLEKTREGIDLKLDVSEIFLTDNRTDDQGDEEDEENKVEDGKADNSSLPELGHLGGVDWWSDLLRWSEPEEHDAVETVGEWDDEDWELEEEDEVAQDAVGGEETHLRRLAEKLTCRLGHSVETESVPFTGPESDVTSIGFELSSQREGDEQLVDESLDGGDGNQSEHGTGKAETLEEPKYLKEDNQHESGDSVGYAGENGTEFLAAHCEDWTHATSHGEENSADSEIDNDRTDRNDGNTDEGTGRNGGSGGWAVTAGFGDTGLGVDEKVWDQSNDDETQRTDDLVPDDVGNLRSWDVPGELFGWVAEVLSLVTCDSGTGQTAESNPGRMVGAGVSTRQPSQEITVIDEKVVPCELMRVEEVRADTQGE